MKLILTIVYLFSLFLGAAHAENSAQADAEFMRMLQARAAQSRLEDELKNPKKPSIKAGRAVLGKASAPILIVAYSDFQCPYCREGALRIEEVRKKYGEKVKFVFKHLPLSFHPMALPAAKRFEAINLQSGKKAYEFHDYVFKNQEQLGGGGEAFLDEAARKVGVNVAKMKKDLDSAAVKKVIDADMEEARQYGIDGTPGFIVAGVTISGAQPVELFSQIIDQRLSQGRGVTSK